MTWAHSPTLADFIASVPRLSPRGRQRIVEQALHMVRGYYVHLPFKRELHDADPVAALEQLLPQAANYTDDVVFHRAMCDVFDRLHDLHTAYHLPGPYAGHVAMLPIDVGCYGEVGERRYIVTRVDDAAQSTGLVRGAELLTWDGLEIQTVVTRAALLGPGANPHAQHARAVETLTVRPLVRNPPPWCDTVEVTARTPRGRNVTATLTWRVGRVAPDPPHHRVERHEVTRHLALDHEGDALRRARRARHGAPPDTIATRLPHAFTARMLTARQRQFGYIAIATFKVTDADRFVGELHRLLKRLPQDGLVLDLRGNSGGLVQAAEQSLQLFTARHIEPQPFQFLANQTTLALCRRRGAKSDIAIFAKPIARAIAAGRAWCEGLPVSDRDDCNRIGRVYPGRVVLLTDARCYSAGDIFAAGFADHAIGHIIGTAASTGAGGANVWPHSLLRSATGKDQGFAALPQRGELRVALRRSLRVGPHAGEVLEERGVTPDEEHGATRNDLLYDDRDLLARALRRLCV